MEFELLESGVIYFNNFILLRNDIVEFKLLKFNNNII